LRCPRLDNHSNCFDALTHAVDYMPESIRPLLRYRQTHGAHERTGILTQTAKLGVAADDIFIEEYIAVALQLSRPREHIKAHLTAAVRQYCANAFVPA